MKSITACGSAKLKVVCHPPKLLDILIEENIEWPEGMVWCVQDDDGEIKFSSDASLKPIYCDNGIWLRGRIAGNDTTVHGYSVSDDWNKTVISYEEYKKAKELHNNQVVSSDSDNSDSSRFERGELPPIGEPSELWFGGSFAYNCEFLCVRGYNYIVWNLDADRPDCADLMNSEFRPLRTEREKAIEELNRLVGDIEKYPTWRHAIAAIIDAGYHKD